MRLADTLGALRRMLAIFEDSQKRVGILRPGPAGNFRYERGAMTLIGGGTMRGLSRHCIDRPSDLHQPRLRRHSWPKGHRGTRTAGQRRHSQSRPLMPNGRAREPGSPAFGPISRSSPLTAWIQPWDTVLNCRFRLLFWVEESSARSAQLRLTASGASYPLRAACLRSP